MVRNYFERLRAKGFSSRPLPFRLRLESVEFFIGNGFSTIGLPFTQSTTDFAMPRGPSSSRNCRLSLPCRFSIKHLSFSGRSQTPRRGMQSILPMVIPHCENFHNKAQKIQPSHLGCACFFGDRLSRLCKKAPHHDRYDRRSLQYRERSDRMQHSICEESFNDRTFECCIRSLRSRYCND